MNNRASKNEVVLQMVLDGIFFYATLPAVNGRLDEAL